MIRHDAFACRRQVRTVLAALLGSLGIAGTAFAQDPNRGSITLAGSFSVPSVYVFRGLVQETRPRLTMWPYVDIGVTLRSRDGGVKRIGLDLGTWNSLHTGSSGSKGPSAKVWYESDWYGTVSLEFGRGVSLATTYTAYCSPNVMFDTIKEISVKAAVADRLAPYGLVAFELDGQADASYGSHEGRYLELGVEPGWPVAHRKVTVTVPLKIGLSLSNYYEGPAGDETFGFFSGSVVATVPWTSVPARFGSWNVQGAVELLALGRAARALGGGDESKIVGTVKIGFSY